MSNKTKNNLSTNLSNVGYKTFSSQFQQHSQQNNYQSFYKKSNMIKSSKYLGDLGNVGFLHAISNKQLNETNQNQMSLLHSAAYYNSPVCALYLLFNELDIHGIDKQGKTLFHLCAYTGHLNVLKVVIQFWKIIKIKQLNDKFIEILARINFKRTDSKGGKLKIQVSKERLNKFNKGQQQLLQFYESYRKQYIQFILNSYETQQKITSRNTFHFCALNKYQKCYSTLEYMIESFYNQDIDLNQDFFMYLNEVNPLIGKVIDPRQYEDCLTLIKDFLLPQKIKQINNQLNNQIKKRIIKILLAKDSDTHTPIYLASKTGSAVIVALLKKIQTKYSVSENQNDVSKNDEVIKIALNNSARNQITDLCQASKNSDAQIINFLISCGQSINKKKTIFGTFALLEAVKAFEKHKNMQPIQILLKSGADVNQQDINGWTIFHYIAEKGHIDILKYIFNAKEKKVLGQLKINKTTNKGYHPLHIAAMNNQHSIIQLLLNEGNVKKFEIESNPLDGERATILHQAAKKGCLLTLKKILLLKGKMLINIQDINGNTCLHLAAANNHLDCIKEIIYFDSDSDNLMKVRNSKGKLAKDLTLKKKCFDNVFTAAKQGDVNTLRNLISEDQELINSATPIKKRTPLILSVLSLQLVNVKFLIDSHAECQFQDSEGKTARQYVEELERQFVKKNKVQLPLIKQIKSLLL